MADLLHDHCIALHAEAQPVVTGTQTIVANQIATKRLRSADRRPILQTLDERHYSSVYHFWQPLGLLRSLRRDRDRCPEDSIPEL